MTTHVCKLIALCTANAYSAEHEMSASTCTRSNSLYGWFKFVDVCVSIYLLWRPGVAVQKQLNWSRCRLELGAHSCESSDPCIRWGCT